MNPRKHTQPSDKRATATDTRAAGFTDEERAEMKEPDRDMAS